MSNYYRKMTFDWLKTEFNGDRYDHILIAILYIHRNYDRKKPTFSRLKEFDTNIEKVKDLIKNGYLYLTDKQIINYNYSKCMSFIVFLYNKLEDKEKAFYPDIFLQHIYKKYLH